LEHVTWVDRTKHEETRKPISNVFAMLGARPNTDWLEGCVDLDASGFVLTAASITDGSARLGSFPGTSPFATSVEGIFAVGDVRSGSVKRVASAVGEGSVVVQAIHRYLSAN
jgi:thioredoxin reductase (NADPH)